MMMLLVDISITFLFFLAAIIAFSSIFRRGGLFWVFPFAISVIFLHQSIGPLYQSATSSVATSIDKSFTAIALLWFLTVAFCSRSIKSKDKKNKELNEARYLESVESIKNEQKERLLKQMAESQSGELYPYEWVMLFDEA